MATMNKFPPDTPKGWDEAGDEVGNAADGLRAKAADVADKATETVKGGYYRAKDALTDIDPVETAREGGQAVIGVVERNPVIAFGLGALGIGLIAWASLRSPPASRWERYQPDFDRLRGLLGDYGKDAAKSGDGALKSSQQWLNAYGGDARDYAGYGGRMIAQGAQKEPIAAMLGIGLAVYALGSLLGSSSEAAAPARKRPAPKR
jgi:hypothetical protein